MPNADEALQEPFLEWSTSLYDECVRARIALLSGAPGLIVETKDGSTMAISGEPMYWSNWLFITSEIAGNRVVDSFIEEVTRRGLPSTIVCKKEFTSHIQPVVEGAGYIRTADSALMTLVAKSDFPQGKGCRLRKLTDTSMNDALAEIIGRGTGAPKDAVNRLIAPSIAAKNIEVFIALRECFAGGNRYYYDPGYDGWDLENGDSARVSASGDRPSAFGADYQSVSRTESSSILFNRQFDRKATLRKIGIRSYSRSGAMGAMK
jgi:hypothetical protein